MTKPGSKTKSKLPNGSGSAGGTPDSELFNLMSNERRSSGDLLNVSGKCLYGHFLCLKIVSFSPVVVSDARSNGRRGSGLANGSSGSRPSSRAGSDIPVYKPPSRPPSRAGSDISDISINSRDSLSATTPSRIPAAQKKKVNTTSTRR